MKTTSWFAINQKYPEKIVDVDKAYLLAKQGKSNREIAEALGFSFYAFSSRYTRSLSLREAIAKGRKEYTESCQEKEF